MRPVAVGVAMDAMAAWPTAARPVAVAAAVRPIRERQGPRGRRRDGVRRRVRSNPRGREPRRPDPVADASACGAFEEAFAVDDHAGDLPRRDEAATVAHRHTEREPAALDRLEDRLGLDRGSHRRGREMVQLHAITDGREALVEAAFHCEHRRLLGEDDDPRCREHGDVTRRERGRSVFLGDGQRDAGRQARLEIHGRTIGIASPRRHVVACSSLPAPP